MKHPVLTFIRKTLLAAFCLGLLSVTSQSWAASKLISGVPKYDQDLFPIDNRESEVGDCTPVACTMLTGYWDAHGWPALIPFGGNASDQNAWGVDSVVRKFKTTLGYNPTPGPLQGTSVVPPEISRLSISQIRTYFETFNKQGNGIVSVIGALDPKAIFNFDDDDVTSWSKIQGYLNNNRPCVLSVLENSPSNAVPQDTYQREGETALRGLHDGDGNKAGHTVCAVGWSDQGANWVICNMGWGYSWTVGSFNHDSDDDWYISQVSPGGAPSADGDDIYEDNDTIAQAVPVFTGTISNLRCLDTLIVSGNDLKASYGDWYKVSASSGQALSVSINFTHANGDLDLRVFGPSQSLAGSSVGTGNAETVNLASTSSGFYYIYVYGANNAQNQNYSLGVALNSGPTGNFTVTPTAGANGSISPNTASTVASGTSKSFTASPNSGYVVDTWSVNGTVNQTGNTAFTLSNVQSDATVRVTFKPSGTGSSGLLVVNLFGGALGAQWRVGGDIYRNSGYVIVSLAPGSYTVSFKPVSGFNTPPDQIVTIVSNSQTTISATYSQTPPSNYTLTLNGTHGYITPQPFSNLGGNSYPKGTSVELTAVAEYNYHFVSWVGDASGSGNPTTIVMDGNKTVTATFAPGDPNLGTITVTIQPPEAAAAGVKWGWNENDFRESGSSVVSDPGSFLLTVHLVPGWTGSGVLSVKFTAGQTTLYTVAVSSTTGGTVGADPRFYRTLAGLALNAGSADGTGSDARFGSPRGVAVDTSGNVFVTDSDFHTVRKIDPFGVVTTIAGLASSIGSENGNGAEARFNYPLGIAVDGNGNLFVSEFYNNTIRKITPSGTVSTLAGTALASGSQDGTGSEARFNHPCGVAVDSAGNVYVAEQGNSTIRKITPSGVVTTFAGLAGNRGTTDNVGTSARFFNPEGVATDTSGNVYIADTANHTIRKITPGGSVSTLAGFPGSGGAADGTGTTARFSYPTALTVDGSGNLYVADQDNDTIRKVTPGGVVTTLAGVSKNIGSTDGSGSVVRFKYPVAIARDNLDNLFIADVGNSIIRTTRGIVKSNQTITFDSLTDRTVLDLPFRLFASASSGLPVSFSVVSGPATVAGNDVTIRGVGIVTIRASQTGAGNFNSAPDQDRSFTIRKAPQTITFGSLSDQTLGDSPFPLTSTASSGLIVGFSVSGPAILSGNTLTVVGSGIVSVRASQNGNDNFEAAPPITRTFTVSERSEIQISKISFLNGKAHIEWNSRDGGKYSIQYKDSLSAPTWTPIETVTAAGVSAVYENSTEGVSARFYRLESIP